MPQAASLQATAALHSWGDGGGEVVEMAGLKGPVAKELWRSSVGEDVAGPIRLVSLACLLHACAELYRVDSDGFSAAIRGPLTQGDPFPNGALAEREELGRFFD